MQVNSNYLLAAVKLASSAVGRSHLPVLGHLCMRAVNGVASFAGTDLEVSIVSGFPLDDDSADIVALVPADRLLRAARGFAKDSEIKISKTAKYISLVGGRSRFRLATIDSEELPLAENDWNHSVNVDWQAFAGALRHVAHAMGTNDVRHYLNGALIECANGELSCVATDGHRLAVASIPAGDYAQEWSAIVPRRVVERILALPASGENAVIKEADNAIELSTGSTTVNGRLIEAKYPDWRLIEPMPADSVDVNLEEMSTAIDSALVAANEALAVSLVVSGEGVAINSRSAAGHEADVFVDAEYSGLNAELRVNGKYLAMALQAMEGEIVRMEFDASGDGGAIRLVGIGPDSSRRCIVMQMRR